MSASSRRDFLKTSALTTAGAAAMPMFAWSQPAFANDSPNDRPRIGCIGLGGMGKGDARGHSRFGDIVICCDVDGRHAGEAIGEERIGNRKAALFSITG